MPILDQYGNAVREIAAPYDLTDPLVAAAWGRALEDDMSRPSPFDGPQLVNERGEPVTAAAPGARIGVFFGSALDGCPLIREEEEVLTNAFRQHIPGFVDHTVPSEPLPFRTKEELLALPEVASWKEVASFYRFSVADPVTNPTLMAELDEGQKWWVVGYLESAEGLGLPDWTIPPKKEEVPR